MNYLKNIAFSFLAVTMLLFTACSDFLDVNDNPTKIKDASLNVLLPTVIEGTARSHYYGIGTACQVTHELDFYFGYYGNFDNNLLWEVGYLTNLNQLKSIVDKSADSPHYKGIARVLQALNIGLMTDSWGNIPYSEALQGSLNTTPGYDSQESLYTTILEYLDEAAALLAAEESFYRPDNDDMVYGGDLSKWIKLAHSLKARYLLHLSNKSTVNWNQILDEAALGFESPADNFQLVYNSVNLNPIHKEIALANETGNFTYTFGKMFVDMLNGVTYGVVDPRLPLIVDKGSDAEYHGLASYDDDAPGNTVDISTSTWYGKNESPLLMMTYAELKFIEAEAQLKLGGDAQTPYKAGVEAHMDMVGVGQAAKADYMAQAGFALNGSNDIAKIMKEKYIALIFNPETWNDMRRYGFDTNIFKGFVNVNRTNNPQVNRDGPAYRALYPSSEFSRNADNATANFQEIDQKLWKDKN